MGMTIKKFAPQLDHKHVIYRNKLSDVDCPSYLMKIWLIKSAQTRKWFQKEAIFENHLFADVLHQQFPPNLLIFVILPGEHIREQPFARDQFDLASKSPDSRGDQYSQLS